MKDKFRPAKMVNWFEPAILFQTGMKALISGTFGNYADRREMQAALDDKPSKEIRHQEFEDYLGRDEIWIDFISDTGDGFNSTHSVALTAAQTNLQVTAEGKTMELPRAKILVMGGDQIYPTPTGEIYKTKFRVPFEAAMPENLNDTDNPHMYAIPGNHDWYDGLGNFMKVFCQQRKIGNWKTLQARSYFAIPLPHNYWIWATDIQLNEDIDKPQQDYFRDIAYSKMQAGDKVILCTAEPAWVYKQLYEENKSYDRFRFFVETYITEDRANLVGKKFQLSAVLTGDLHHYSHYCASAQNGESNHYIDAGGGGAFLHLTHNLPKKLDKLPEKGIELKTRFPDKKDSYKLLLGNLIFPLKNYFFSFLLGGLYFLFYWLLQSHSIIATGDSFVRSIGDLTFSGFLHYAARTLLVSPFLALLTIGLVAGFAAFTDKKKGIKGIWIYGILHGLLQCLSIYVLIWILACINYRFETSIVRQLLMIGELIIVGALLGGFWMGLYLFTANLFFGIHIDESSSSLVNANYKNFLRMHIDKNGLTIYPIGIRKVTTDWEQAEDAGKILFKGKLPEYHLIEKPIFIPK